MLPPFFDATTHPHTVCVTGGLTGIGRAIAIGFLSHGANVCINYFPNHNSDDEILIKSLKDEALAAKLGRKGTSASTSTSNSRSSTLGIDDNVLFVPGDISLPETGPDLVAQCASRFSRIDTFVSNAGICKFEEFLSISPSTWQTHHATNLSGAFYAVQAAARHMSTQSSSLSSSSYKNTGSGSIIGISSISALVGGAQQCHYTPTKAGVLNLMQSCATALGQYNIRCNALLPGTIRTQLNDEDLRDQTKREKMETRIPLQRLGVADDLFGPALFLAVPELSGYITGAAILVDGGAFVNFQ